MFIEARIVAPVMSSVQLLPVHKPSQAGSFTHAVIVRDDIC